MTALPRPLQTISILSEIYTVALDSAERLELQIAEAADELSECSDWRHGILTIRLSAARTEQQRQITQAAQALQSIERLRAGSDMEASVMGRVMSEFNRGQ